MSRFPYVLVADKIGNIGGHGYLDASSITEHHAGVQRVDGQIPAIEIMKAYCSYHKGHMPYHVFIPFDSKDKNIYISQWLNQKLWHNNNGAANADALSLCVDGNFDEQQPLNIQLAKMKQFLDDIPNWFKDNGWIPEIHDINPRDNKKMLTYWFGKTVHVLHSHQEVGKTYTACCGKNLIPKMIEYRTKGGKVDWVSPQKPACEESLKKCNLEKEKLATSLKKVNIDLKTYKEVSLKRKQEIERLEKEMQAIVIQNDVIVGDLRREIREGEIKIDFQALTIEKLQKNSTALKEANQNQVEKIERQASEITKLKKALKRCQDGVDCDLGKLLKQFVKFILSIFKK